MCEPEIRSSPSRANPFDVLQGVSIYLGIESLDRPRDEPEVEHHPRKLPKHDRCVSILRTLDHEPCSLELVGREREVETSVRMKGSIEQVLPRLTDCARLTSLLREEPAAGMQDTMDLSRPIRRMAVDDEVEDAVPERKR